jgi:hypothetical protein
MSWSVHPYPGGKSFGFTIVHDADSAYSRRLAPLIDFFDEIGLRTTITVFPFWAAWGHPVRSWQEWRQQDPYRAPVAVPLEDPAERRFYLDVAGRGHEIAMHTPSETSSPREDVVRAFAFFEEVFDQRPRVYVEHSPLNNLDAQRRFGSDPSSIYYNTDLLNQSGAWVWVCDEDTSFPRDPARRYDVLSDEAGPFCPRARTKFGIERAFLRSPARARTGRADGDGFLDTFTGAVLDDLQASRGLSLLYTHLNYAWLDLGTRAIRAPIRERLLDLAERDVWFAPAGTILDRFAALSEVELKATTTALEVINHGSAAIEALALIGPRDCALTAGDVRHRVDSRGIAPIGDLRARERRSFRIVPA